MITWPSTLRAARPIVWISDVSERRKPSLSASRIATSETSGRSRPSRSRLMPTSTSNSPSRSVAQDLDPLERVDLGVEVADPHAQLEQVVGEVLGHLLGERGDQHPLRRPRHAVAISAIRSSIWPLVGRTMTSGSRRPGGPDDLLDDLVGHLAARTGPASPTGRRPGRPARELLEAQRPVVERGRQPEPVLDEGLLAGPVALVLAVQLRHGDVALVEHDEEVVGEVVEQGVRGLARAAGRRGGASSSRSRAVADLAHHLEVVRGAHAQPLRLEQLARAARTRRDARRARPRCPRSRRAAAPGRST